MTLFCEEDLQEYVKYWGGDIATLSFPDYKRGRSLAAVTFYALHHPEAMPPRAFWQNTIKQAVTFLWDWIRVLKDDKTFRTPECKAYFKCLLDGFIAVYGIKEVFRFRYQNWNVVDCQTMVDQLWTMQEMLKEQAQGDVPL